MTKLRTITVAPGMLLILQAKHQKERVPKLVVVINLRFGIIEEQSLPGKDILTTEVHTKPKVSSMQVRG